MSDRTTTRLAWAVWAACAASALLFAVFELVRGQAPPATWRDGLFNAQEALGAVVFSTVGALIASKRRAGALGWLLLVIGASFALSALGSAISDTSQFRSTLWQWGIWMNTWSWAPGWFAMVTLLVLLFPDGRLLSPRWRWVVWVSGASILLTTVTGMFDPTAGGTQGYRSPLPTLPLWKWGFDLLGLLLGIVAAVASIVALVRRFRGSSGDERQQMKWFVYGAVATLVLTPARAVVVTKIPLLSGLGTLSVAILPAAIAVAILKYHLYDIDVVINKTVVYAVLAAFITAVYVGIVVGVGALIGQETSKPNLGLSILATAVVAVAFQPVRSRIQRVANRLVYGSRATPYEVLSEFSTRMAQSFGAEELLPRMARILGEGTGARSAAVWLNVAGRLTPEAAWPLDDLPAASLGVDGDSLPAMDATLALPVRHRGELLGVLSLSKAPGDRLTPAEEHLATDLAAGAGLVMRNVRLTEELLRRLEELRASRQRIVAAQDSERRRLERNIHDGAQQQLVALAVKVRLARQLTPKDPARAAEMLAQAEAEITQALDDLRDLARGIYPPLLADQGLAAALTAHARRSAILVEVEATEVGRHPQDIEAAVYFCVLEALQNVSKYARASRAVVRIGHTGGALFFDVTDDGVGFDPSVNSYGTGLLGMADRLSALGGELRVNSLPGAGTTVSGTLPVAVAGPAPIPATSPGR